MKIFKLGTIVQDSITGNKGMLTHLQRETGGELFYLFQPRGLSPKTGEPVDNYFITSARILGGEVIEAPYLGEDIIGTSVEDDATGFKGIASASILHINGCLHIEIQPTGTVKETGARIKPHEFDIRRLKGEVRADDPK